MKKGWGEVAARAVKSVRSTSPSKLRAKEEREKLKLTGQAL